MKLPSEGKLLRIFVGEQDKWDDRPLYEAIVHLAHKQGLAGATVLRGVMGFGAKSRLHTAKILRLSEDMPMVVEIVDTAEKIDSFRGHLDGMIREGLVTVEDIHVALYRAGA